MIENGFFRVYNWNIFNFEDKELEKNIRDKNYKKQFIQKTDLEIY